MKRICLIIMALCVFQIINWTEEKCNSITATKMEDCTILYPIGTTEEYRCCYVFYKQGAKETKKCRVLPYNYNKLATIVRVTYGNVKELDIQCSSRYLLSGVLLLIMLLF